MSGLTGAWMDHKGAGLRIADCGGGWFSFTIENPEHYREPQELTFMVGDDELVSLAFGLLCASLSDDEGVVASIAHLARGEALRELMEIQADSVDWRES